MATTQQAQRSGAQALRANAQQAAACALGANGKCSFCQREGVPVLLLRYAVIPNLLRERAVRPFKECHPTLDQGLLKQPLKGHKYTLRTLRAGFVHVYLGKPGLWQLYAVTADGLLRLLANPDDPDHKTERDMTEACKRDGHNLPASFIHIPHEYANSTVWVAFSQNAWSKAVRQRREAAPAKRMQALDCKQLGSNPGAHPHAFEITGMTAGSGAQAPAKLVHALVDEYATDAAEAMHRRRYAWQKHGGPLDKKQSGHGQFPSVHGFHGRAGQLEQLGKFADDFVQRTTKTGKPMKAAAVALFDPVGIVHEINHTRLMTVQWRSDYVTRITVARPMLISQAIMGLKAIYEHSALMQAAQQHGVVVVDEVTPDTRLRHQGQPVVTPAELPDFATRHTVVTHRFEIDPITGRRRPDITSPLSKVAGEKAAEMWGRLEARYDEKGRAQFAEQYETRMRLFQEDLNTYGEDYAAWAGDPAWTEWFDDYDARTDDWIKAAEMAAPALSGGPTDAKSQALWKRWLCDLKPFDKDNPVYQAYFGARRDLIKELLPERLPADFPGVAAAGRAMGQPAQQSGQGQVRPVEKADKLYDLLKSLATSDEGAKVIREVAQAAGMTTALAHIQLAITAAASKLGNELPPLANATVLRAQQAGLYLYRGVEGAFVTVRTTLGEYVRAMKEAGRDAAQAASAALDQLRQQATTSMSPDGRKVRALALAGLLNLSDPRVRDLAIDVTIWTMDKVKTLTEHLKGLAEAERRRLVQLGEVAAAGGRLAEGLVKVAGITLSREAAQASTKLLQSVKLTATQANILARRLIGSVARVGGSADVLMAAGALYFQTWSYLDAHNKVKEKLGPERGEAYLSIASAGLGMLAATTEIIGASVKTLVSKIWGTRIINAGGTVAAVASFVEGVQAMLAASRSYNKGDIDAGAFSTAAGIAFFVSAGFGVSAAIAGATALLGPLGIALLFAVMGVGLLIAAARAEDTSAEIWLDRCFWGKGKRSEGKWSDREVRAELAEMNSMILGAKAEIAFNDNWDEHFTGFDSVIARIMLPQYDRKGSAMNLVLAALDQGGREHLLYRDSLNRSISSVLPIKTSDGSLQWERGKGGDSVQHGTRTIEQHFLVARNKYKKVILNVEYWPDSTDEAALLQIQKLETD